MCCKQCKCPQCIVTHLICNLKFKLRPHISKLKIRMSKVPDTTVEQKFRILKRIIKVPLRPTTYEMWPQIIQQNQTYILHRLTVAITTHITIFSRKSRLKCKLLYAEPWEFWRMLNHVISIYYFLKVALLLSCSSLPTRFIVLLPPSLPSFSDFCFPVLNKNSLSWPEESLEIAIFIKGI